MRPAGSAQQDVPSMTVKPSSRPRRRRIGTTEEQRVGVSGCSPGPAKNAALKAFIAVGTGEKVLVSVASEAVKMRMSVTRIQPGPGPLPWGLMPSAYCLDFYVPIAGAALGDRHF